MIENPFQKLHNTNYFEVKQLNGFCKWRSTCKKSSKLGAKCYKIVQNDVPYANSVVNTINEQAENGQSRRHI